MIIEIENPFIAELPRPYNGLTNWTSIREINILCSALIEVDAKLALEIGTYMGYTTLALAINKPNCIVKTIDLPAEQVEYGKPDLIGIAFRNADISNIIQLRGNSRNLKIQDQFDIIFIDGGHDYETCISDSYFAFDSIRKGGIVFWHDYKTLDENLAVTKVVDILASTRTIYHIKNTMLAFWRNL